MAADYNKPVNTDNYADILGQLRDNIAAAQTMLNDLTGVTNIPTDAVRYDQATNKFQSYNGSTFGDLVLSPSGGGTGITNWTKASTAEAKAGTADKYPDAAGVLASINENSFSDQNLELIWSGSSNTVDMSALPGGWPGDGLYYVKSSVGSSLLYLSDSVIASSFSSFSRNISSDTVNIHTTYKSGANILEARTAILDLSVADVAFSVPSIEEIYKVG